jgi:hypothetical protein
MSARIVGDAVEVLPDIIAVRLITLKCFDKSKYFLDATADPAQRCCRAAGKMWPGRRPQCCKLLSKIFRTFMIKIFQTNFVVIVLIF